MGHCYIVGRKDGSDQELTASIRCTSLGGDHKIDPPTVLVLRPQSSFQKLQDRFRVLMGVPLLIYSLVGRELDKGVGGLTSCLPTFYKEKV